MLNRLAALPAYEYPSNALLNLNPINQAITDYRQREQQGVENARADEQLGMQRTRLGMERQRFAEEQKQQLRRRIGGLAMLTLNEPDEARRAEQWKRVLTLHPDAAKLDPSFHDPRTGPMALLADAGMAGDYLQAQIARQQAAIAAEASTRAGAMHPHQVELLRQQAAAAGRRDEVADMTARLMREAMGGTPEATPPGAGAAPSLPGPAPRAALPAPAPGPISPPPGITISPSPMSAPAPAPADPMLIRTQAAAPSAAPGTMAASPGATPEPTVQIFGRPVPLSRATAMGQAFLLNPSTKAIGEQIMKDVGALGVAPKMRGELDEKAFNTIEGLARLNAIRSQFRPEFQTIEDRLGYAWTDLLARSRSGQRFTTPQQQAELAQFAAFRAEAVSNLNQYIKEITGAAMTIPEAERLIRAMPNPGTGILDGDSPVGFKAKLDRAIGTMQQAMARYSYLRNNGFRGAVDEMERQLPLTQMPRVIQRRTEEIQRELQQSTPGIDVEQLKPLIQQRLRREFGQSI